MNAVILLNFGEPEEATLSEVVPFLERIFRVNAGLEGESGAGRARELAERRAPGLLEEYRHIGGSPLNRQARAQAESLEAELRRRGHDARVYVGTQFSTPTIREAAEAARAGGAARVIGLPMYPTCGPSTTVAALEELSRALDDMAWAADFQEVSAWDNDPRYTQIRADGILAACRAAGVSLAAPDTRLVFSAHGTPLKYLREGSRYDAYTAETCARVAAVLGVSNCVLGYQNHTNRPIEWTQPDIADAVRGIGWATDLVVVPISFLHEQSETLAELDVELRELVEALGMRFHRVPVPHGDPRLTALFADIAEPFLRGGFAEAAGLQPCRCRTTPRTWCRNAASSFDRTDSGQLSTRNKAEEPMDVHMLIEEALGAWAANRQAVISEIENIPEEKLDVTVGPGARSARQIGRHILEAGYIFGGEIALPNGGFNRVPFGELAAQHLADVAPTSTRAELLAALRTSIEQTLAELRATGPTHLIGSMHGLFGDTSRLGMLHFTNAHEYYHCGQLTMCARAAEITPAMTQRYAPKS